jgi:hypothetical protein
MADKWHDEEEAFLKDLEKQCNSHYEHFTKEYIYYNKLSSRFNVPILIISAINALCAIALNDFLTQRYVSILNAILSSGTGILGSIQLYLKINEKLTNSLRSSIHVKKLALKISKELTLARPQRGTDGSQFLSDCFAEFNTIIEQSNPVERKLKNFLQFSDFKEGAESEVSSPKARIKSIANSLYELSRRKSVEHLYHSDSPRSEP